MLKAFRGKKPKVHESAFIAETAVIIGDVEIGANSSIWFGVVIRGDINSIRIGKNVNAQDNTVIHVEPDYGCVISDNVSIGHNCTIHAADIESNVIIGMGATVLSWSRIGKNSIVAAGSVVTENTSVEENTVVAGIPAKKIKDTTQEHLNRIEENWKHYVEIAKQCMKGKK